MTVPFQPFYRFFGDSNTREMEPLKRTSLIIASNHIPVRDVIAKAVSRLSTDDCTLMSCSNIKPANFHIGRYSLLESSNCRILVAGLTSLVPYLGACLVNVA